MMSVLRLAPAALATLSWWVLAANVFVDFQRVRIKLLTRPIALAHSASLSLAGNTRIPGEQLVLVYRARNTGATPVTVTVRLGGLVLADAIVGAGASARVDVSWARSVTGGEEALELSGTSGWTLEYAELANVHGFTRGAFEALVLPRHQSFTAPPAWLLLLFLACSILLASVRPPPWPRPAHTTHAVLVITSAVLFLLTALSPWLSPYRVVLSARTFTLAIVLIWLPAACLGVAAVLRWLSAALATLTGARARAASAVAIVVAGIGYAVLLWLHMGAYAGGADSSGYLNHARLLAEGHVSTPMRRVAGLPEAALPEAAYVPLGFRNHGAGRITPTYPMGLPLALAAAAPVVGWTRAPAVAMWLHALLGVALIGLLAAACELPRPLAVLAAIVLATSPLYLFMSVQLMSDTPALVWTTTAVVLCCWPGSDSRQGWRDVLAGGAVAVAVLIRPTDVLVFVPVAICLGVAWRRWFCLAAGGAPGAVLLLAYNAAAYGATITTGYGDTSRAFSIDNVLPSLRNYAAWLPVLVTPVGLLALGLPVIVRRAGRMAVVLMAWALSIVVFYAFYYHTHEWWWYLRFLLPAFPPIIVGALWVGLRAWRRWCTAPIAAHAAPALVAVVAALVVGHNVFWTRRLEALAIGPRERVYVESAAWASANLPANAAILTMQTSGSFLYYTRFAIVRWDQCDRVALEQLEGGALDAGTPLYAVFFPFELSEQRAFDRIPGKWSQVARVQDVTLWRLDAKAEITSKR